MTIGAGDTIQADDVNKFRGIQTGVETISFTSKSSSTQAVTFDEEFAEAPYVDCNINSGAGSTAGWNARAISISVSGFTIFVFGTTNGTWASIPVGWSAIATS